MPPYQATAVDILEERRSHMGLALLGQLTVVVCRLLTGHLGSATMGLAVFVIGNRARCSLHSGSLTAYVMLGGGCSALDTLTLLQELLAYGTSFIALPVSGHFGQDLSAVSMLFAPLVEYSGARIAWESYLDPTMLFSAHSSHSATLSSGHRMNIHARLSDLQRVPHPISDAIPHIYRGHSWPASEVVGHYGQYYFPPAFQQHVPPPSQETSFWSWLTSSSSLWGHATPGRFDSSGLGPPMSSAASDAGSNRDVRSEGWAPRFMNAASSRDPAYGWRTSASDVGSEDGSYLQSWCCAQCGDDASASKGWKGTGAYSDRIYCRACWAGWSLSTR